LIRAGSKILRTTREMMELPESYQIVMTETKYRYSPFPE